MKVGDKVYLLDISNRRGPKGEQKLEECYILKIGRKYITVSKDSAGNECFLWMQINKNTRLEKSNLEKSNYTPGYRMYLDEQTWLDEREESAICAKIRDSFEYSRNKRNLPLPTLRKIIYMIENSE